MIAKQFFPLSFLALSSGIFAQPTQSMVINDFRKNGVIAVEGVVINKEWYKDHYLWKASLRTILPVKPEEVDGLKGVTLVRHVVAHYECSGSSCSSTWNGLAYSEYKGINLPLPSAAELNELLKKEATSNPAAFFRSMSGKYGITEIGVNQKESKFEWVNPRKLNFNAYKRNKEEVSYTEVALVETPLLVTLIRDGLKSPWRIDNASEVREYLVEISRSKKTDEANTGLLTGTDAAADARNKAEITRLKVPIPPKYTTAEAAAKDAYLMLFNLNREQYYYYLSMIMGPQMRCENCQYTLNGNGEPKARFIIESAYDGNGKFIDQFCMTSSFQIEGNAFYFKNKRNDFSPDSYFMIEKAGSYYYINSATLQVSKDASVNASLKAVPCDANPGTIEAAGDPQSGWKTGDKVLVEENGKWYPATVLKTRPGEWFIHYDGYSSSYDLWVGASRIKNR